MRIVRADKNLKKGETVKRKIFFTFFVLSFISLAGAPALHAEQKFEEAPELIEEGQEKIPDQAGGNFQAASDQGNLHEVFGQDDTGGSDPSAFEGDTDSMPGERAPENLPMDDAPVDGGIGIQ